MTDKDELTIEEKINELEKLADEIGLDISKLREKQENMSIQGNLTVRVYDEDGDIKSEQVIDL